MISGLRVKWDVEFGDFVAQYTIGQKQSIQRIFEEVKFSAIQSFQSFYSTIISYTPGVNTEAILEARKTINEITEALAKHL